MEITATAIDRFWRKVDRSAGEDACWLWTGPARKLGYGRFHLSYSRSSRSRNHPVPATHVAWFLATGKDVPVGLFALHRCDNPPCVNARHLFIGDQTDNMRDMTEKGRSTYGSRNARSRLTESQVKAIRQRRAEGLTLRAIGQEFGVHLATVSLIARGQTWTSI